MSQFNRSLCVYCGSRPGQNPSYVTLANNLGHFMAQNQIRLVYGGGDIGIMGAVATGIVENNGDVLGVIPEHLKAREQIGTDLTPIVVTKTMHERKEIMFKESDGFVILPGGAGTMEEFFEVLTWAQIGLHQKPIYILNLHGCWDSLIALIDGLIADGFADANIHDHFSVFDDMTAFQKHLAST